MKKRHVGRGALVAAVIVIGLLSAMAGTAVAAKPPVTVNGQVATSGSSAMTTPGCFHIMTTDTIDARLQPGGLVKGTLTTDAYTNGLGPCGPGEFQLTANGGVMSGSVVNITGGCDGPPPGQTPPGPGVQCHNHFTLSVTDGTGRFHKFTGTLQVDTDWMLTGGLFPGGWSSAGTGTITGTLVT